MFRDVRMSELIEANPNLEQQMRDWQTERHHRGENPFDWAAFRAAVSYVGASDPGADPPSEFFWFTAPDGGGPVGLHPLDSPVEGTTDGPSSRLVAPGQDRTSSITGVKYWR